MDDRIHRDFNKTLLSKMTSLKFFVAAMVAAVLLVVAPVAEAVDAKVTHTVYFDIEIDGKPEGRVS